MARQKWKNYGNKTAKTFSKIVQFGDNKIVNKKAWAVRERAGTCHISVSMAILMLAITLYKEISAWDVSSLDMRVATFDVIEMTSLYNFRLINI